MKLLEYFTIVLVAGSTQCARAQVSRQSGEWPAAQQPITNVNARVVAVNIPGASAITQVGPFLNNRESS